VKGLAPYADRHQSLQNAMWDAYDLAIVLLDTGARYSEITNLEWKHVSIDDRTINLWRPKVQNESVLFMTDRVYDVLNRRHAGRNQRPHVFQNKNGDRRGYAGQSIRKALKRAGLVGFTIHTLRHTHATRLVQNGVSIYEVKEVLGHTDIKTTMRYAHLESQHVHSKARDVINRLNTAAIKK